MSHVRSGECVTFSKFNIAKPIASHEMAGIVLAIVSLVIYIASQLLFRYSTLAITYPVIGELQLRDAFTNVAMAFAIAAIAVKPHGLHLWQGVLVAVTLMVLMYSAYRTNDYRIVQGYMVIVAVAGIDLDRLCKVYFLTVMPILIIIVLLSLVGLEYNMDSIPNSRLVFSYGFSHPNQIGGLLFSAIGAMAFTCWDKPSWKAPLILAVAAAVFSYVSLSSHASAGLLATLALVILVGHVPKISRVTNIPRKAYIAILVVVPLCFLGLMLVCTAFYDAGNPVCEWLNKFIHGRPNHAHEYYVSNHGFTHLGREYVSTSSYHSGLPFASVDSGYDKLAMVYGLFTMYVLIVTYLACVWKTAFHKKRFFIMCVFLMNSAYLLVESIPLFVTANFGVLFLSQAFTNAEPEAQDHDDHISRAKHLRKVAMEDSARIVDTACGAEGESLMGETSPLPPGTQEPENNMGIEKTA